MMTEEKKQEEKKEEVQEEKKEEIKVEEKIEETKEKKEEVKEDEPVEVPAKFKKFVEEIEKMSILELAELVKILEKKFGVSAAPQMMAAPVAATGGDAASAEEKSSFNIVLTGIGEKKIETIKVVRDITQKGLKDSKDLVDAVVSGEQMIKENVKKEEAEEIKKKFEAAGAKVELK